MMSPAPIPPRWAKWETRSGSSAKRPSTPASSNTRYFIRTGMRKKSSTRRSGQVKAAAASRAKTAAEAPITPAGEQTTCNSPPVTPATP
jgi:hypothetical protein